MIPDCHLRPATHDDCEAVQSLVFAVLAEYGLKPDPADVDADLSDLEGHYAARGGFFDVVADKDGRIIATVGLQPQQPGLAELRKMYVHPQHRGRGLGRFLLTHALTRARELGLDEVYLETASVLKEAVAMYEKAGFKRYAGNLHAARADAAFSLRLH